MLLFVSSNVLCFGIVPCTQESESPADIDSFCFRVEGENYCI